MEAKAEERGFFYVLEDAVEILFVDDDPIVREFALVNLATETAGVTLAADGFDALEQISKKQPGIVLLDLEMPRLDGFEVLKRLRADPRTQDLPVIVVTGREDVAAIDRAFETGATSFLVKPINWRLLSYQIRYVLRAAESDRSRSSPVQLARLQELARAGVRLLSLAMNGPLEMKSAAQAYAEMLAELVGTVQTTSLA